MGFSKRRANSKAKILPHDFDVVKEQYLKSVVSMEEIPHQLIIIWDQRPLKIAPSSNWTMVKLDYGKKWDKTCRNISSR